jgi:Cytochrome P460
LYFIDLNLSTCGGVDLSARSSHIGAKWPPFIGAISRATVRETGGRRFMEMKLEVVVLGVRDVVSAISGPDKYTVRVPKGLAFSDFRGYEDWQVVAVSQTDDLLKAMVANPTMIDAYRAGIPGNGKPFPEGSEIAKIEWKPKKNLEAPFAVRVPDLWQDVFFIEKDSQKFPSTKGWAYAAFDYTPTTDTFAPDPTGTVKCGFACHTKVAAKDYIFTAYGTR